MRGLLSSGSGCVGRSIRDAAARLTAKFQRRQGRVLAQALRGDLIDRHATAAGGIAIAREDSGQPGFLGVAVRRAAFPGFVAQAADDGEVLAIGLERLGDKRKLEIPADLLGLPLVLKRAMGKVDEAQPRGRLGGGLRHCRAGGDHGIQQGQGDRRAGAFKQGASRQMFSSIKHAYFPPSASN